MKYLLIFALLCCGAAHAQSDLPDILGSPTGLTISTGAVKFSPASGSSVSGAITVCLYSGTSCGNNIAGTEIFYTLDGTPATPASTLYRNKTFTTGSIVIPDTAASRSIIINAVLVKTVCIDTTCMVRPTYTPACSVAKPCYAAIVQDGQAVKANLKTVVACPTSACPNSNFAISSTLAMPTPINNGTTANNLGCRGVPTQGTFQVSLGQPSVDLYTDSNTCSLWRMNTAGATTYGGGSNGDTEILEPYDDLGNVSPYNVDGCPQCTQFDISRLVALDHESTSTNAYNGANMADLEQDDNQWNWELGTQTTCTNGVAACYGSGNVRNAPYDVKTTSGSIKYGGWQHNGQDGGWKNNWPAAVPNHDSPMPFGTIAAVNATSCAITFTPGDGAYNSQTAWGLDPRTYLLIDQGTSNAETIAVQTNSGNTVTGCVRGIGGTAHSHAAGALASLTVLVQLGLTHGPAAASGTTRNCTAGPAQAPDALYYNYFMVNSNFYGLAAYQALMPANIVVQQVWTPQTFGGKQYSPLCDYYSTSKPYDYPEGRFNDQLQLYTKLGSGVSGKVGIFWMHDNTTAHFGVMGIAQSTFTQAP